MYAPAPANRGGSHDAGSHHYLPPNYPSLLDRNNSCNLTSRIMKDGLDGAALPGIGALPQATVRQLGSGQVLIDPSTVVKELIDNALDARANSVFIEVTPNAVDAIHVKDDGHGIPAEDRNLLCRRYCTSKIRDFHDIKQAGGRWLGFRGEALSCMAEMSGSLSITTRVEGEAAAVNLSYDRNGELIS